MRLFGWGAALPRQHVRRGGLVRRRRVPLASPAVFWSREPRNSGEMPQQPEVDDHAASAGEQKPDDQLHRAPAVLLQFAAEE